MALHSCIHQDQKDAAQCGCLPKRLKCNGPSAPKATCVPVAGRALDSAGVDYDKLDYKNLKSSGYIDGGATGVIILTNRTGVMDDGGILSSVWSATQPEHLGLLSSQPSHSNYSGLYVGHTDVCHICGPSGSATPVGGPGAAGCQLLPDACANQTTILGITPDTQLPGHPTSYTADVLVTCSGSNKSDCLAATNLRGAAMSVLPNELRVAFHKQETDPMFVEDLPSPHSAPSGVESVTTQYKLYLVALNSTSASTLNDVLRRTDRVRHLASALLDESTNYAEDGVQLTSLDIVNIARGPDSFSSPTTTRRVEVVSLDSQQPQPLGPTQPAVIGDRYKIILHNFPHDHSIRLEAMSTRPMPSGQHPAISQPYSRKLKVYTFDANKDENAISWSPGAQFEEGGNHFIRATDLTTGTTDSSLVFTMVREPRRRLTITPELWIQ